MKGEKVAANKPYTIQKQLCPSLLCCYHGAGKPAHHGAGKLAQAC